MDKIFDYTLLNNIKIDKEFLEYYKLISYYQGRLVLYIVEQNNIESNILDSLIEIAKRQSTVASNAIEGIVTKDTR